MQARGESRSRRTPSLEPRHNRLRQRTHSIPRSTPTSTHLAQTLVQSIAFFSAASILHQAAPSSLLLISFFAFLFAFISVLLLLVFSPSSLTSLHHLLRRIPTTSLLLLAALYIFYFLSTLTAIRLIGPARALIAIGAHPTLVSALRPRAYLRPSVRAKRTYLLSFLLALVALAFLAYDATGGQAPGKRAARVRDRLMHTRAAKVVHEKVKSLSQTVRERHFVDSLSKTFNSLHFTQATHPSDVQHLSLHVDSAFAKPPQANMHHPHNHQQPHAVAPDKNTVATRNKARRQLLAVVKEQQEKDLDMSSKKLTNPVLNRSSNAVPQDVVDTKHQNPTGSGKDAAVEQNQNRSQLNASNGDDEVPMLARGIAAVVGVSLAVSSSFSGRVAAELRNRVTNDLGEWIFVCSIVFLLCTFILFPAICVVCLFNARSPQLYATIAIQKAFPKGVWLGILFLFLPMVLQMFRNGVAPRSMAHDGRSLSKGISMGSGGLVLTSLLDPDVTYPKTKSIYATVFIAIFLLRRHPSFIDCDPLTFSSLLSAIILLCVSMMESNSLARHGSQSESRVHERSRSGKLNHITLIVMRSIALGGNQIWHRFCSLLSRRITVLKDFISQSRSNKASWQVLNFLLLQTGMATVELIYATATDSVGLISISADNFLCSVALAIGLLAIRVKTRKSTAMYTYGFSRFESLCGFVNGIMLIYVAVLVVFEAFERINGSTGMAAWHVLTVCFIGVTGNSLGLYFLPPESRRENHNVQGIYLHIVANTMAFSSLALTTVVSVVISNWDTIDVLIATSVAVGMICFAIPLLIRSGRVLVLKLSTEKERALKAAQIRLSQIEGVISVSGLRAWNLSPNSIVASVRLKVSANYHGEDRDILFKARSIFASMGVAASQCTIQVSRVSSDTSASTHVRKRSQVSFSSSTELEGLYIPTSTKEDSIQPKVVAQLTM